MISLILNSVSDDSFKVILTNQNTLKSQGHACTGDSVVRSGGKEEGLSVSSFPSWMWTDLVSPNGGGLRGQGLGREMVFGKECDTGGPSLL